MTTWSNVKDGLPKKSGTYYCKLDGGRKIVCQYGTSNILGKGRYFFSRNQYGDTRISNVAYWMKLPD